MSWPGCRSSGGGSGSNSAGPAPSPPPSRNTPQRRSTDAASPPNGEAVRFVDERRGEHAPLEMALFPPGIGEVDVHPVQRPYGEIASHQDFHVPAQHASVGQLPFGQAGSGSFGLLEIALHAEKVAVGTGCPRVLQEQTPPRTDFQLQGEQGREYREVAETVATEVCRSSETSGPGRSLVDGAYWGAGKGVRKGREIEMGRRFVVSLCEERIRKPGCAYSATADIRAARRRQRVFGHVVSEDFHSPFALADPS